MSKAVNPIAELFTQGVQACREDKWREALPLLTEVARMADNGGNLPGIFYSYLGVAIARCEGRKRDGLELCRYAVRRQPKEPENHLNLAMAYLMVGRRAAAVRAMEKGLRLRPRHRRLLELQLFLGRRRSPILPFLGRSHFLNVLIGRARAWWEDQLEEARQRRRERTALAD